MSAGLDQRSVQAAHGLASSAFAATSRKVKGLYRNDYRRAALALREAAAMVETMAAEKLAMLQERRRARAAGRALSCKV